MGANRLFWSQELLDEWMVEEKIIIDGEKLDIPSENQCFRVSQAVYFSADVGDGSDIHGLVGRVKEVGKLTEMGAEHYMDSVVIADSAYEVVPGFIGEPIETASNGQGRVSKNISGAIAAETGEEEGIDDRELLARFLIDNL